MKKLLILIVFLIPLQGYSQGANLIEADSKKLRLIAAELWLPIYERYGFQYRTSAMLGECGEYPGIEEQLKRLNGSTLDNIIKIVEVEIQREESNFNLASDELLAIKTKDLSWSLYLQLTAYGFGYKEALSLAANPSISTGARTKKLICNIALEAADGILSRI
jgi:hypothetical protein